MKLSLIYEATIRSFNKLSSLKTDVQKSEIGKLLGLNKPLSKIAEGSFATIYEYPSNDNILIKVTSHEDDIKNTIRAQRLNSNNIVKLFAWPDGKFAKQLPRLKSWALIVENVIGRPMAYSTGHFLKLGYNGNFELAKDWLNAGGSVEQINILKLYNTDNDHEMAKLAELFGTLQELSRYGIDLSDFDQNIIDQSTRYVIIDLGF